MKYLCMASQPLSTPATPRLSRIVQEKAASALLEFQLRHLVAEEHIDFNGVWKGFLAGLCQIQLGKHTRIPCIRPSSLM